MGTSRNDAAAVSRELLDKGWNREKLALLVGPDTAKVIGNTLEGAANRQRGRANLFAGSRTQMRAAAQKRFPGEVDRSAVGQGLRQTNLTGLGLNLLVSIANKASGGLVTKTINASRSRTAEGAARLLSASGSASDQVLQVLAEAERKVGRALNAQEQIDAVTRAFTPGATGGTINGRRPPLEITVTKYNRDLAPAN